jgi:hypothetical protein
MDGFVVAQPVMCGCGSSSSREPAVADGAERHRGAAVYVRDATKPRPEPAAAQWALASPAAALEKRGGLRAVTTRVLRTRPRPHRISGHGHEPPPESGRRQGIECPRRGELWFTPARAQCRAAAISATQQSVSTCLRVQQPRVAPAAQSECCGGGPARPPCHACTVAWPFSMRADIFRSQPPHPLSACVDERRVTLTLPLLFPLAAARPAQSRRSARPTA